MQAAEVHERATRWPGRRSLQVRAFASQRQLSVKRFFAALDGSDGEIAALAAEANETISAREAALDAHLVPFLRMSDIADREVEVLHLKERDHLKASSPPNMFAADSDAQPRPNVPRQNGYRASGSCHTNRARVRLTDMVADDDLVCPPPVSA
jgi:hypothetical protein